MTMPYRNRGGPSSAYRAMLMFRTVGILMAAVAAIAIAFPWISALAFSLLCLLLMVPALLYQMRLDSSLIHTGGALVDDGMDLYVVVGTFNLGFGRRHHMNKRVSSCRISWIRRVYRVRTFPFGIAVQAEAWTASSKKFDFRETDFDTPGAMKETLMAEGKRRRVLFRLERCLLPEDEAKLLRRLGELEQGES